MGCAVRRIGFVARVAACALLAPSAGCGGGATVPDAAADAADLAPPSVAFVRPAPGEEVRGVVAIELEAHDDVGVARIELALDELPLATLLAPPWATAWDGTGFPAGDHTLRALASDRAGRTAAAEVTFRLAAGPVDAPPAVAIARPVDGSQVCGAVAIEATATDDVGVVLVEIRADGAILATFEEPPYEATWDARAAGDGPHGLRVTARDTAGQIAEASVAVLAVSSGPACDLPPEVTITAPAPGAVVRGDVSVTAEAADDRGVASARLLVDGLAWEDRAAAPWTFPWPSNAWPEGAHALTVEARDAAGQTATAAVTVTVDRTAPTVTIAAPSEGGLVAADLVVRLVALDAVGLATVALHVDGAPVAAWETPASGAELAVTVPLAALACGGHTVEAHAFDRAGLPGLDAVGFTVSGRPPCDADCDGHAPAACGGADCDDADPAAHPGALDPFGDGIDADCDGLDGTDADGDGVLALATGGTDCDDADPAVHPRWIVTTETVASVGLVGIDPSLALDAAGHAHVAFHDLTGGWLLYATDATGGWVVEAVDDGGAAGDVGGAPSLAVAPDGAVHISYYDLADGALRYATGRAGAWTVEVVDAAGDAGEASAIALDGLGRPRIAYYEAGQGDLRWASRATGAWQVTTIATAGDVGWQLSLALDAADRAHVAYLDFTNRDLRYATDASGAWQSHLVDGDGDVGWSPSIAALAGGGVRIAYHDAGAATLKVASGGPGAFAVELADGALEAGWDASLVVDAAGRSHVASYAGRYGDLRYTTDAAGAWSGTILAREGDVGQGASLALVDARRLVVAHFDATRADLLVTRARRLDAPADPAGDGRDTDCDGVDGVDADGDGFADAASGDGDCDDDDPGVSAWAIDVAAADGEAGSYAALVVDPAGVATIAYHEEVAGDLWVARGTPGAWTLTRLDAGGVVGEHASAALDRDGRPHVAYYDATDGDLEHAWDAGGLWQTETLASAGDVGSFASLALDGGGSAHVACRDAAAGDLVVVGPGGLEVVDAAGDTGYFASLALDAAGARHVAYWDGTLGRLRYATDASGVWGTTTVDSAGDAGRFASLALDATGAVHVAYYERGAGDLRHATNASGAWTVTTVDAAGDVGAHAALALDAAGEAHIAYHDASSADLRYARGAPGAWTVRTVSWPGSAGTFASIALHDGRAIFAYHQADAGELRVGWPCAR